MSTGPKVDKDSGVAKKRGSQMRPINKTMATAIFKSGAPAAQVQDIFVENGVICPSDTGLLKMLENVKDVVEFVSEAQLKQNRKDHVSKAREMSDYEGDHKFTDDSGNEHSICVGPVAVDGNGEKRAYNHIITGDQHATVIISLVTGQPLYVWHDQISCIHCQRKVTQLLNEDNGKRAQDITAQDLSHPGKECSRNSKHGPAGAEEWAVGSLAEFLLLDPDTKQFLPDDEAILANIIVADGDTKGPNKFIRKQSEIVPTYQGKAQYLPDIGHFIKCISNSFYALSKKYAELKGVSLLEPSRIRCICGDISKYLREYGEDLRNVKDPDKLDKSRTLTMRRIDNLIDHHCGDHSCCEVADCKYRQTENKHFARHKTIHGDDDNMTRDEILEKYEDKIDEEYAEKARFRGMSMSMGKSGRIKVKGEITKRLDENNIDRVALAMSSNRCENFFSVLVKYTCGKRVYFGKKNGWKVRLKFVAASKSDNRITDKIRHEMGVSSTSVVREERITKANKRKQYYSDYKKQDKYKDRRSHSKQVKCKQVKANASNPSAHKKDKLSPKEDVHIEEPAAKSKTKKRNKNPCSNCGDFHPGKCPEPKYRASRKKSKIDKKHIASLF